MKCHVSLRHQLTSVHPPLNFTTTTTSTSSTLFKRMRLGVQPLPKVRNAPARISNALNDAQFRFLSSTTGLSDTKKGWFLIRIYHHQCKILTKSRTRRGLDQVQSQQQTVSSIRPRLKQKPTTITITTHQSQIRRSGRRRAARETRADVRGRRSCWDRV